VTTRREFLNRTLLGSAAFGAGLLGGWMPLRTGSLSGAWSLAARVPAGGEARLEKLARHLGLDLGRGEWVPLVGNEAADLVLLHEGRLLDPAEWPAEALALRAEWAGRPGRSWLRLPENGQRAAGRAIVRGAGAILATLDLDREGERVFVGRNGHRLVVASREGTVAVVEAGCRHQHCLRQGRVSLAGERLVCAPAGLLVSLEA